MDGCAGVGAVVKRYGLRLEDEWILLADRTWVQQGRVHRVPVAVFKSRRAADIARHRWRQGPWWAMEIVELEFWAFVDERDGGRDG